MRDHAKLAAILEGSKSAARGNGFALWRDGKRVASAFMKGDVRTAGKALKAGPELLDLFATFYDWSPIAPSKPRLTSLKADWGKLLFPEADKEFADGYAQAVTFGLLMARARDIPLGETIEPAAKALRKTNTLIGSALALFTEEPDEGHPLATALRFAPPDRSAKPRPQRQSLTKRTPNSSSGAIAREPSSSVTPVRR